MLVLATLTIHLSRFEFRKEDAKTVCSNSDSKLLQHNWRTSWKLFVIRKKYIRIFGFVVLICIKTMYNTTMKNIWYHVLIWSTRSLMHQMDLVNRIYSWTTSWIEEAKLSMASLQILYVYSKVAYLNYSVTGEFLPAFTVYAKTVQLGVTKA